MATDRSGRGDARVSRKTDEPGSVNEQGGLQATLRALVVNGEFPRGDADFGDVREVFFELGRAGGAEVVGQFHT